MVYYRILFLFHGLTILALFKVAIIWIEELDVEVLTTEASADTEKTIRTYRSLMRQLQRYYGRAVFQTNIGEDNSGIETITAVIKFQV
jgi:hypothetical protein